MSRWQSVETVTIAVLMIAGWASMLVDASRPTLTLSGK